MFTNSTIELQAYNVLDSFNDRLSYPYYRYKFDKKVKEFINKNVKDKNLRKILKRDMYLMYAGYSNMEALKFQAFVVNRTRDDDFRPEDMLIIYNSIHNRLDDAVNTMINKAKKRIKSMCKTLKNK